MSSCPRRVNHRILPVEPEPLNPNLPRGTLTHQVLHKLLVGPHLPAGVKNFPLREQSRTHATRNHREWDPELQRKVDDPLRGVVAVKPDDGGARTQGVTDSVD